MPVLILLTLLAGTMLPVQAAINARLGQTVGGTLWATTISGAVLTAALAVVGAVAAGGAPKLGSVGSAPWWAWTGGLCGALVLAVTAAAAPRLGAATTIALVVAGQVLCAVARDHFGLLGLAGHPLTLRRMAAAGLLVGGALLIK